MPKYRFGFCSWYTPFPGPFSLTFTGEAGYDGIQISDLGGDEQGYPLNNRWIQSGFLDAAASNGIEIQMVNLLIPGTTGIMKHPHDTSQGRRAIENIRNGIDACAEMGIPNIFISTIFAGRIDNEDDFNRVASYMEIAGSMAKEKGIELLYESFMGVEKTLELYEKAGGCFKLCYDTLNPYIYGFGCAINELKRYDLSMIHTIHIKDCTHNYQYTEPIGKGIGRFYEMVDTIKEIGYSGWIVNENNYFFGNIGKSADPFEMAKNDLETLKSAFVS